MFPDPQNSLSRKVCQKRDSGCRMKRVAVVRATARGGEIMRVLADNADAKLLRRLRVIPRRLRAIASLVDRDRCPPVVRALWPVRFSTRHLMILVAVVGVFLGVLRLWLDVSYRLQKAAFHADMAALHRGRRPANMAFPAFARLMAAMPRRPQLAVLHSRMKEKWQDAAAHPWLPVEADPPNLSRTP